MNTKIETKPNLHVLTSGLHSLMNGGREHFNEPPPVTEIPPPPKEHLQLTQGLPVFGGGVETRSMKRTTRSRRKKLNIRLKEGLPDTKRKKRVVQPHTTAPPSPEPEAEEPYNDVVPEPVIPEEQEEELTEQQETQLNKYPVQIRPWIRKIFQTQNQHPEITDYKEILKLAKESYTAKGRPIPLRKYTKRRRRSFASEEMAKKIFQECYMKRYDVTKADLRTEDARNKKSALNKRLRLLSRAMRMNMIRDRSKNNTVYFDKSKFFRCTKRSEIPKLSKDFKYTTSEMEKCDPLYIKPLGRFTPKNIYKPAQDQCI